jgi:exonuclease III
MKTTIILMMDANKGIYDNKGGVQKLLKETSMIDTFSVFTGAMFNIPTYTRGSKRIDFIFTSNNLLKFTRNAGYTRFFDTNESDHRGAFIELSNLLLDNRI